MNSGVRSGQPGACRLSFVSRQQALLRSSQDWYLAADISVSRPVAAIETGMPLDSDKTGWERVWSYGSNAPTPSTESKISGADYLRGLREVGTSRSEYAAAEGPSGPAVGSPGSPEERRRNQRYKCEGSAELRTEASAVRTWATFSDISLGGCYVEMMTTYPVGTRLDLKLQVDRYEVNTVAIVRVSYPFLGMGIEFTEMAIEDRHRLEGLIEWLAGVSGEASRINSATSPPPRLGSSTAAVASAGGKGVLLEVLQHFFENHTALTREEFAELVRDHRET